MPPEFKRIHKPDRWTISIGIAAKVAAARGRVAELVDKDNMATIKIPTGRATASETADGLLITIPSRKNWFLILFLGFWLMGWLFGEVTALNQVIRGHSSHWASTRESGPIGLNVFLIGWLGAWTVGGGIAIVAWLWNLVGVEKVLLGPSTLITKREVLGLGPAREYELPSVTNLRVNMGFSNTVYRMSPMQMVSGGIIAFDYGAKTFHFGVGLDEAEAEQIIAQLRSRYSFSS